MLILKTLKLLFILLNSLDIHCCTTVVMEIQLKYFVFFPCTWKINLLNASIPKLFSAIYSNVSMYSSSEKTMAIIMMTENDKDFYEYHIMLESMRQLSRDKRTIWWRTICNWLTLENFVILFSANFFQSYRDFFPNHLVTKAAFKDKRHRTPQRLKLS